MLMLWYSIILGLASVGLISLIMSFEYMKRSHLILAALSILAAIGVFIKIGVSRETVGEAAGSFIPATVTDNLHYYMIGGVVIILGLLKAEGTINWVWRRVHPKSAPTDDLRAGQRGHLVKQTSNMSAALIGTSTRMFSVPSLDVRTIALIRLSLFALKTFNSKSIIGIESHLKLGDGRRYRSFHGIVAEMQTRRIGVTDIVHPYWRAINGNHSAARNMFKELCLIVRNTGQANKQTINRITDIGKALGLSPEDMAIAIKNMRR